MTASSSPAVLVSTAGRTAAAAIAGSEARPAVGLARWRAGSDRPERESLYGRAKLSGRITLRNRWGAEPQRACLFRSF